jgi:hypothetical protein
MENKFSNKFMIYILIITQIITNEALATGPQVPPPLKDEPPTSTTTSLNYNSSILELEETTTTSYPSTLDMINITNTTTIKNAVNTTASYDSMTTEAGDQMLVPPAEIESEILQVNTTEDPHIPKIIFK